VFLQVRHLARLGIISWLTGGIPWRMVLAWAWRHCPRNPVQVGQASCPMVGSDSIGLFSWFTVHSARHFRVRAA